MHGIDKDEMVGENVRQHRRTIRLARGGIATLIVLTLAAVAGGIFAEIQRRVAQSQRAEAQHQTRQATLQRREALRQSRRARTQATIAERRRRQAQRQTSLAEARRRLARRETRRAERQQAIAETQRGRAECQTRMARSGQLAAAARSLATTRVDAALLLGLEAYRTAPGVEARSSLLAARIVVGAPGLLGVLHGRTNLAHRMAFSPGGRRLATVGADKAIRLWDVRTRRQVGAPMTSRTEFVNDVAFSPDGRMLASAHREGSIRLWSVRTHRQLGEPLRPPGVRRGTTTVTTVAFSPDGRTLAAGAGGEGNIRWWACGAAGRSASRPGCVTETRT